MSSWIVVFDQLLAAVRFALVVIAGIFAVFCVIDWLVRTRRVNLFGSLARFSRSKIDPILEPIERRVVRAGGNPASAPLWALAAVVVGGILLVSVLDFLRAEILGLAFAVRSGPGGIFKLLVSWTFDFIRIAILVRVVSSWLPVSPDSGWIRWSYAVSEPILKPLRQIIPALGPIDITPIIAYFLIGFLQGAVLGMM
ncbi:MAG TPA: YggT family protein [Gemmatimonadaceae bacterium]|jgi:YggT family protein|nr:YggT family protein [Gemmatimonadaceae bacterium]